jgi:hypothetical protein
MTIDQLFALADLTHGVDPYQGLQTSIAAYQNEINANPAGETLLGQEVIFFTRLEALYFLMALQTLLEQG